MVLPSSSNFFCPPDKFPASSFAKCLRFKNSITSKAFCFICYSSFFINFGFNKALTMLSPDWFPGTIIKFSSTVKFVNS